MRMIFYWIIFLCMYIILFNAGQSPSSIKDGKTCSFHQEKKMQNRWRQKTDEKHVERTNPLTRDTPPGQAEGNYPKKKTQSPHQPARFRLPPCIEEPAQVKTPIKLWRGNPEGRRWIGWMDWMWGVQKNTMGGMMMKFWNGRGVVVGKLGGWEVGVCECQGGFLWVLPSAALRKGGKPSLRQGGTLLYQKASHLNNHFPVGPPLFCFKNYFFYPLFPFENLSLSLTLSQPLPLPPHAFFSSGIMLYPM